MAVNRLARATALLTGLAGFAFTTSADAAVLADESVGRAKGLGATALAAFVAATPGIGVVFGGEGPVTVYGPAFSGGVSARRSAHKFVREHAAIFGAEFADLSASGLNADAAHEVPVSYDAATGGYRFTLVSYAQVRDGLPVWQSDLRLLVRNEAGHSLVLAKSALKDLGTFTAGAGLKAKAIGEPTAVKAAKGLFPTLNEFEPARMVIYAGTPDAPAAPILAWEVIGRGPHQGDGVPQKWLFIVDATTGTVVHRESQIYHVDVTGNVSAWATPTNRAGACDPGAIRPMPYARVQISGGAFAYADADGSFSIPNAGTEAVTVTSSPRGQFFRVFNQAMTTSELSQTVTPPGPANFIHNPAITDEITLAETDAYIQSNIVRDYTLAFNPAFPAVATGVEFPVRVNISNSCNAFYDGSSINFYLSGGGCNNSAFSTIVYHEYGHHLVASAGSGQGAYGEGFGDVMGVLITDESAFGRGFSSCSGWSRNADNSCTYHPTNCSSCGNVTHTCGQILSGSVWAIRDQLLATNPTDYRQIISSLAVNSVLLHQGSSIGNDIVVDFLTLDDNDGDITNGTPHYNQIAAGFVAKGFTPPTLPPLGFVFSGSRPQLVSPSGGTSAVVEVLGITGTPMAGSAQLVYDNGSGWTTVSLPSIGVNTYRIDFPAAACGSPIRYYVTARTTGNVLVSNPLNAPAAFHTTVAATGTETPFSDTFETDTGWTIGAPGDAATLGIWVRTNPNAAIVNGVMSQPEDDVTPAPGVNCFVTGDAAPGATAGAEDVDGGATTLTSPVLNLSQATAPVIGYWRWYSNHLGAAPGADTFNVLVTNNNGSSWTPVEVVGPTGPETEGGWYYHEFNVSEFVTPTSQVRVRFIASDFGEGSLVEAAVDDFAVTSFLCDAVCEADFDGDGQVAVPDIFAFLSAWFAGDTRADVDGAPGIAVPDIFAFLSTWFASCP